MSNVDLLKEVVHKALSKAGLEVEPSLIVIENSKDKAHGDYSTNVALKYAKGLNKNPREFAQELVNLFEADFIEKVEIAGPGFINFFLKNESLSSILGEIFSKEGNYGRGEANNKKVNVEFVSANPTGDLHLGHTRIAVIGDCISNILDFAGYKVTREYYLNDCGNQVEHLGNSLRARYLELLGEPLCLGDDDYHGEDLIEIAKAILDQYKDTLKEDTKENREFFIRYGIDAEFSKIKKDLEAFRVGFDIYSKESDIRKSGKIEETLAFLKEKNFIYVNEGATFLKTSEFLDDKDRPIIKADGKYTYFLPDICYHYDKIGRGYDFLIDVLGADHHGYINRMKSALMMKGYSDKALEVELVQIVRVYKDGVEIKMSKRTGKAITHRELIEEVGVDSVRYFFADRSQSSHLDFNLNLALERSSTNPVFYAQYAHARCCSLLSLSKDLSIDVSGKNLKEDDEISILKTLASFKSIIMSAAENRSPAKICLFIHTLAEKIHNYYAKHKIIDRDNIEVTSSRLALIKGCKIVLENALKLIGVSAPEKM
ncbi:MAG: arginine--tRNA ligase [Bacilli bacterium]|nr:arginine--tRNA ligase [Bacilli bacterium]MDY6430795.1 arginine--tRNA ligase [Bacilli bacterium]